MKLKVWMGMAACSLMILGGVLFAHHDLATNAVTLAEQEPPDPIMIRLCAQEPVDPM